MNCQKINTVCYLVEFTWSGNLYGSGKSGAKKNCMCPTGWTTLGIDHKAFLYEVVLIKLKKIK